MENDCFFKIILLDGILHFAIFMIHIKSMMKGHFCFKLFFILSDSGLKVGGVRLSVFNILVKVFGQVKSKISEIEKWNKLETLPECHQ